MASPGSPIGVLSGRRKTWSSDERLIEWPAILASSGQLPRRRQRLRRPHGRPDSRRLQAGHPDHRQGRRVRRQHRAVRRQHLDPPWCSASSAPDTRPASKARRMQELVCSTCGNRVLLEKHSPTHTSVRWLQDAESDCPEFARRAALGEHNAWVPTCAALRDSIERAVESCEG